MTIVNFKVYVQVSAEHSANGDVKASVLDVIGGEMSGEVSHTNVITQELSFSIPMVWKQR